MKYLVSPLVVFSLPLVCIPFPLIFILGKNLVLTYRLCYSGYELLCYLSTSYPPPTSEYTNSSVFVFVILFFNLGNGRSSRGG